MLQPDHFHLFYLLQQMSQIGGVLVGLPEWCNRLFQEDLFEQQRIMSQSGSTELVKRVVARAKEYRKIMHELGYGHQDILQELARILGIDTATHNSSFQTTQEMLSEALRCILHPSPSNPQPSHSLTQILVALEVAISQLREQDSEEEEAPRKQPVKQADKREKGKKKNNEKKKSKKGRPTALEEIQSKALAENFNERAEMVDALTKIEMIKGFLQRKVLLDLCQQSMLNFLSPQLIV